MDAVFIGFVALGLALLVHVVFVSITLGAGLTAALLRWLAYKRGDRQLELSSRRVLKLLLVSELYSGVWGTVITVFLAGFFTPLLTLATNALFIPLSVAVASIMVRIPAIAASWQTWGRISPRAHTALMWIMAASGFGIPFGFRAVFAELHYPLAVGYYLRTGTNPGILAYHNPLFWLLYLHTVAAVISTGGFAATHVLASRGDYRAAGAAFKMGAYMLFAQLIFGPAYWLGLSLYSPLLYELVTHSPLMAVKVIAVAALAVLAVKSLRALKSAQLGPIKFLTPLAALAVVVGEVMNSGIRYPSLVFMGREALQASLFANFYVAVPFPLVGVILAFAALSAIIFLVASYLALVKHLVVDEPEE